MRAWAIRASIATSAASGYTWQTKHRDAYRSEVFLATVKGPRRALERRELKEKYEGVEPAEACDSWEAEYAKTPGTEPRRLHILSGAIFPIYDKVMGSSGIQTVKIARAILADGQALVGLNLSASDVPNVEQRLGIGIPLAQASPAEMFGLLIDGARCEGRGVVGLFVEVLSARRFGLMFGRVGAGVGDGLVPVGALLACEQVVQFGSDAVDLCAAFGTRFGRRLLGQAGVEQAA